MNTYKCNYLGICLHCYKQLINWEEERSHELEVYYIKIQLGK